MTAPVCRQTLLAVALAAALLSPAAQAAGSNTLTGWALMPAATLTDGPTSGQFAGAGAGGNPLPLVGQQPVQGFSTTASAPRAIRPTPCCACTA
jgi:hypothetical protein